MWGVKPFWRKAFTPLGATVLYGEYAQYNDYFGLGNATHVGDILPNCPSGFCDIIGSEVQRWGLGVVQEIDSAAMHVWFRWQHQELEDVQLLDVPSGDRFSQDFDDFDLFQAGGIIFF
jgi:hypothetical protein